MSVPNFESRGGQSETNRRRFRPGALRARGWCGWVVFVGLLPGLAQAHTTRAIGPYVADRFEIQDGLPENSATAMVQTPDGFLWFGTFDGLVRYDGVEFTVFDSVNTPELPSSMIVNLHLDRLGTLWCSTSEGLVRLTPGGWIRGAPASRKGDHIRTFAEAPDGTVWLVAFNGEVAQCRGGRFVELPRPPGDTGGGIGHCDHTGRFWLLKKGFLGFWDGTQWQAAGPQPQGPEGQVGGGTARDGSLWMVDRDRLLKLAGAEVVSEAWLSQPIQSFWSLAERPDGELWITSFVEGMYVIQPTGSVAKVLNFGPATGYPDKSLRFVFEDREGIVWVGSNGGGLGRLTPRKVMSYGAEEGLTEPNVRSLGFDPSGRLWIGSFGGGVWRLEGDEVVAVKTPVLPPGTRYVESVLADRAGQIWVSAMTRGTPLFRLSGSGVEPMVELPKEQDSRRALFEDSRGRIWVGGGDELAVYEAGRVARFPVAEIHALAEEPGTGAIWAAGRHGLFRQANERFAEVRDAAEHAFTNVICLRPTADGAVWLGTDGRGLLYLRKGGGALRIGPKEGLPVKTVSAVIADDLGAWWLASNRGVAQVHPDDLQAVAEGRRNRLTARLLTVADGMPSDECALRAQPTAAKSADGRIWFATRRGVAVVDPLALGINPRPPVVFITESTYLDPDQRPRPLIGQGNQPAEIPPGSSDINFEFAALSYLAPEKVVCRCRLERSGRVVADHTGPDRKISYELLPPGDYRLHVTAANADGIWNPTGATVHFRVLTSLWEQSWFRVGLGLLAMGMFGGAAAYVVHSQRVEHQFALAVRDRRAAAERAAAADALRASEIRYLKAEDEAERRRQRESLARDMHDGIGGVAANLQMLAGLALRPSAPEQHRLQLEAIASLAREGLLEVRSLLNVLDIEEADVGTLVAEFRRYGRLMLEPHRIDLSVTGPAPGEGPHLNARLFLGSFRVFKEALANVVKHARARTVRVRVTTDSALLKLVVADDGVGLRKDLQPGRGLRSMESRVQEFGGRMECSSHLGLQLSFEIPLSTAAPAGPPAGPTTTNFAI